MTDFFDWQSRKQRKPETVQKDLDVPKLWPDSKAFEVEERQMSETGIRKFIMSVLGKL